MILYSNKCPNCIKLKKVLDSNKIEYTIESDMNIIIEVAKESDISSLPFINYREKILTFEESMRIFK